MILGYFHSPTMTRKGVKDRNVRSDWKNEKCWNKRKTLRGFLYENFQWFVESL